MVMGMNGLLRKLSLFVGVFALLSFTLTADQASYDIKVQKSIKQVKEHLYQVSIQVDNGNVVNGIAKYEARLPITADFVQELKKDPSVNFKVDGRKLKMIWMHIQKNRSYTTVFQIKSKLAIDKLKMNGTLHGHQNGDKFSLSDTTSLVQY